MRRTYVLNAPGKHPDRQLDAAKHDIRKYMTRERRRPLPAGVDFWDFDCQFGADQASAAPIHPGAITQHINDCVNAGGTQFYVALLTKPGVRKARSEASAPALAPESTGADPA